MQFVINCFFSLRSVNKVSKTHEERFDKEACVKF